MRRLSVTALRKDFTDGRNGRRSIDCLVMTMYREERKREAMHFRGSMHVVDNYVPGSGEWAFKTPAWCQKSRHDSRHRESKFALSSQLFRWEDNGPWLAGPEGRV